MMKPAPVKVRRPAVGRKEGADEVFMVRFAFGLIAVVAVIAAYQTIAWLAG
jgi:hypothetical protein